MAGIKESKELVEFIGALASAGDKATRDGLGYEDIALFIGPLMLAAEAFKGLEDAKLEIGELDDAEIAELREAFAAKLDLVDDQLEGLVEDGLAAAANVYSIYKKVKSLRDAAEAVAE